jgi:glucose-1-phosphate thymidylyltransferase
MKLLVTGGAGFIGSAVVRHYAGTHQSLLEAAEFVATLERRQGIQIASPEEIAWRHQSIDDKQLSDRADRLGKSGYGQYLRCLLKTGLTARL